MSSSSGFRSFLQVLEVEAPALGEHFFDIHASRRLRAQQEIDDQLRKPVLRDERRLGALLAATPTIHGCSSDSARAAQNGGSPRLAGARGVVVPSIGAITSPTIGQPFLPSTTDTRQGLPMSASVMS